MKLEEDEEREKIIVRSDGTVTYVGKDIAYQLWKFGLLEKDFYYEPFLEEDGKTLWISTAEPTTGLPAFRRRQPKVYNVIDTRQAYLQKVVTQGLRALKFDAQAAKSVHFSYEMVALSPKSLEELGYEASEEEKDRAFLEVSGRKGLGRQGRRPPRPARGQGPGRGREAEPRPAAETREAAIAREIATGALRYFMLKFARNSLIVFDFEEALSFEGETGPYLQYTCVRLGSIFRKLEERTGTTEAARPRARRPVGRSAARSCSATGERPTSGTSSSTPPAFEEEVLRSVDPCSSSPTWPSSPSTSARRSTRYYHHYPILAEENPELSAIRAADHLSLSRSTLETALALMGIPLPERM